MPESAFTTDAEIAPLRFTADAWIMAERWKHHRVRDHFGIESDLYVALSERVGKYEAFTPIHWVLVDIVARIDALEDSDRVRSSFVADALIAANGTWGLGFWAADATFMRSYSVSTLTVDAVLARGGSFSADAVVMPRLTIDAFIV